MTNGFFGQNLHITDGERNVRILHSLGTKFPLKLTLLNFGPNLPQRKYSQPKTEKVNSTIEFCIFQLFLVLNFTLNKKFAQKGYF